MDENKEKEESYKRKNRVFYGGIYPGIWLIVVGAFFLLNNFGYFNGDAWGKLWPIFIILPGLFLLLRPRR